MHAPTVHEGFTIRHPEVPGEIRLPFRLPADDAWGGVSIAGRSRWMTVLDTADPGAAEHVLEAKGRVPVEALSLVVLRRAR